MLEEGIFDIHCHIVPGVDDGAADIEETRKLLEMEYKQGVRNIILTPLKSALKFYDSRKRPEKPLVYRSELMPDLIIYEYENRYEVYRDYNGRLTYLRTEAKR